MSFLRGFSIAMGASFFLLVFSFLNNKLIYVFLNKSDNGIYFIFLRLSMLISLFFGEWFRLSNVNIAGDDRNLLPSLSANNLWYSFSVGLLLVLAAFALYPVIGSQDSLLSDFGVIPWKYILIAVIVGATVILRESSQSILLVAKKMLRYGFTFVIWGSVALLMNFIFLAVLRRGLDYAVAAWFAGITAGALWAYFSVVSYTGFHLKPSGEVFSRSRAIGLRAWLAVLGMFIMINIHIFIIVPIAGKTGQGLAMVAIFSVGFRVFQLLQRVSNVSGVILFSHVVQEEKPKGYRMTMLVARNIILFSAFFCILALIGGKSIIRLISSSNYLAAYIPLLLLLPGIIAINAGSVINNVYWGHGYPYKVILAPFVVTIIGIALDAALIPRIGVSGAAFSFSVMGLLWFTYIVMVFRKDSGFRLSEILIPRYEDVVLLLSRFRLALYGGKR